jgi:hypothetical protein
MLKIVQLLKKGMFKFGNGGPAVRPIAPAGFFCCAGADGPDDHRGRTGDVVE